MMTEKIAHLRALLIDDGWDVERRADALKALAEIEAAWGALLAPVEVEREADAFRLRWLGSGTWCPWSEVVESGQAEEWRRAVRPLVEDRARFAREVAGLRGIVRAANGLAGKARAEIARLTAEIDRLMVALAERTTERDILGRWYSGARAEVIERCEEIRRLRTAAQGQAWERLVAQARIAASCLVYPWREEMSAALAAVGSRASGPVAAGQRPAAPQETRLEQLRRQVAAYGPVGRGTKISPPRAWLMAELAKEEALAAVEPRVDVKAREIAASLATHAEILGGDSRTVVATHEVRLDGETAIVAEQWTDGAEVVKRYEVRMRFAEFVHLALNTTPEERREVDARGDWRGVEPRADAVAADPTPPVDPAEQATVEIGRVSCSADRCDSCNAAIGLCQTIIRNIPGVPRSLILCAECSRRYPLGTVPPVPPELRPIVADVTAITHDFRPGAQDGMPRLADVEAREIGPRDEVTDEELAEVVRLDREATPGPWESDVAYLWHGNSDGLDGAELFELTPTGKPVDLELAALARAILPRLARAEQARRAAPVDREALGRLVRDVWIAWAKEQPSPKPSWLVPWEGLSKPDREVDRRIGETIARVAIGAAITPPRALTEAEARSLAERIGIKLGLAKDGGEEPVVTATRAILGWYADRGDVPPEARPTVPGCDGGHPGCGVCDALDETAGVEEVDPSAAKIAAVPSPACNVDHTTDERPRVLGGECADCLHRPPLHEPTCTKARCSHTPARTWTEEQIRAAWCRAQDTGRPARERAPEPDDLACGWEHVRAALHGEAV